MTDHHKGIQDSPQLQGLHWFHQGETKHLSRFQSPHTKSDTNDKRVKMSICLASVSESCRACGRDKQPLYTCANFKALTYKWKMSLLATNKRCHNCLSSGHTSKNFITAKSATRHTTLCSTLTTSLSDKPLSKVGYF